VLKKIGILPAGVLVPTFLVEKQISPKLFVIAFENMCFLPRFGSVLEKNLDPVVTGKKSGSVKNVDGSDSKHW